MNPIEKYDMVLQEIFQNDFYNYKGVLTLKNYIYSLKKNKSNYITCLQNNTYEITIHNTDILYETLFNIALLSLNILNIQKNELKSKIKQTNRDLFIKKNSDYGNSYKDFGLIGILVRLNDKINRILTLEYKKTEVMSESIEDSINDLYNYCIIGLMYKLE